MNELDYSRGGLSKNPAELPECCALNKFQMGGAGGLDNSELSISLFSYIF